MIDFDVVTGSGPGQPQEKPAALPAEAPSLRPPRDGSAPGGATAPAPKAQRPAGR